MPDDEGLRRMPPEEPDKKPLPGVDTGSRQGHSLPLSQEDILDVETENRLREEAEQRKNAVARIRSELAEIGRELAPTGLMGPAWWAQQLSNGVHLRSLPFEYLEQRRRMIVPFSQLTRMEGDVPACVLYSRPSVAADDAEAAAAMTELASSTSSAHEQVSVPLAGASIAQELHDFAESLKAAEAGGPLRVVLVGDPQQLRYFRVRQNPLFGAQQHAGLWDAQGFLNAIDDLAGPIEAGTSALFPFLIRISKECDRRWMLDAKGVVSAAAKQLVESVEPIDLSAATAGGVERLHRLRGVWEAARTEIKARLEEAIAALSSQTYPTLADKEQIAAFIQAEVERWGFVPVAPKSGLPAYLRAKDAPRNPNGFFYFDPLPGMTPVLPPEEKAQATGVDLPVFKLTAFPRS